MEGNINLERNVVVDASFVLCRMMPDEVEDDEVWSVFSAYTVGQINLKAPKLLKYEVLNSIKCAVNGKRLTKLSARTVIKNFLALNIDWVEDDNRKVFGLALENDLTYYDACYLSLAIENGWKLKTFDKKLKNVYKLYLKND